MHRKQCPAAAGLLLILALALLASPAQSAYMVDMPITLSQPDGKQLSCFVSGDEFYNWIHDSGDYVIVQHPQTGYYVYAVLTDGNITHSETVAGSADPALAGFIPGIMPAQSVIDEARETLFAVPQSLDPQPAPQPSDINNIVVFIRFSDDAEYTDLLSSYNNVFNATTSGTSSLKNYFLEASYGSLTVNSTFYPLSEGTTVVSYQDSHPRDYYMPYSSTNTIGYVNDGGEREQQMLANCINAIKAQVPSTLNIDKNSDGNVDNVCFIVKGSSSTWGSVLWPHMWALYMQNVTINGKRVWGYNFQFSSWILPSGVGVLAHEMIHTLGAPDFYHYEGGYADPAGSWEVMCGSTNPPQHPTAYVKQKYLKWIDSIPTITQAGIYYLDPVGTSPNCSYKIPSPNSPNEYFVVEYRRKAGTFEGKVPGSGLIVYRINPSVSGNSGGPPDELYILRPNGTATSTGQLSSAHFSSSVGRTALNATTNPAPVLSNWSPGGIALRNIGSAGTTISFMYGDTLPDPIILPGGGIYAEPVQVTLTCPTNTGRLHYTLDGSDPSISSPYVLSGGTVTVDRTATLKVKSFYGTFYPSGIVSAEYAILNMGIRDMKSNADGRLVGSSAGVVTAAWADEFYIESESREAGILVRKAAHGLTPGTRVTVTGVIGTNSDGERFIEAQTAEPKGTGTVLPVGMAVRSVGGGDFCYFSATGVGQRGVDGGFGLNNIGLLIRVGGRFEYIDSTTFTLDEGAGRKLLCTAPVGTVLDPNWDYVTVTGVSSCYSGPGGIQPRIRVRDISSVAVASGAMVTGRVNSLYSGTVDYSVESPHPYPANYDNTWTITGPAGTGRMRVFFTKMQLQNGYDRLYVMNKMGTVIQTLQSSATVNNTWSSWVAGNEIRLRLTTNATTQNYGFSVSKYEVYNSQTPKEGVTVTLEPGGLTSTTDANGVYFFRNLQPGTYTVSPFAEASLFNPVDYTVILEPGQYLPGKDFQVQ